MKKLFALLLAGGLSAGVFSQASAQNTQTTEGEEVQARTDRAAVQQDRNEDLLKTRSTRQDKRREKQLDEIRDLSKARNNPQSEFKKPDPYRSESFTVTKYKESKTKRKLRKGEGRTRMSVPNPKGKPLKHKKKSKFRLFGN